MDVRLGRKMSNVHVAHRTQLEVDDKKQPNLHGFLLEKMPKSHGAVNWCAANLPAKISSEQDEQVCVCGGVGGV